MEKEDNEKYDNSEERYRDSEEILRTVRRAYESNDPIIKHALAYRIEETKKRNKDRDPIIDDEDDEQYWCETCGSHSHQNDPDTSFCYVCNTDNWEPEN